MSTYSFDKIKISLAFHFFYSKHNNVLDFIRYW